MIIDIPTITASTFATSILFTLAIGFVLGIFFRGVIFTEANKIKAGIIKFINHSETLIGHEKTKAATEVDDFIDEHIK